MTAAYVMVTPIEGVTDSPFAIVADDAQAHYIYAPGNESPDIGDARIATVEAAVGTHPTDMLEWLKLATYNLGYYEFSDPVDASDIEAATVAAHASLSAPSVTAAAPPLATEARADRVAFQRQAMDTWSQLYPAAAAGDVDDPEADLALVQLTTPPVDPDRPHQWLPIATTEADCGFCYQLEDAAIHQPGADTITSGSN